MKDITGKLPVGLIPATALFEVAKVLQFGRSKYYEGSWRNVSPKDLLDAALRHIYTYQTGEEYDTESGLHHLSHAACNLLFLLVLVVTQPRIPVTMYEEPFPDSIPATLKTPVFKRSEGRGLVVAQPRIPVTMYEETFPDSIPDTLKTPVFKRPDGRGCPRTF